MRDSNVASDFRTWVVLVPQLPPKPDYLRVKLQRRLKRIGAVALRGSAYVLPAEATGAFERLRDEIIDDGGEHVLWLAVTVFDVDDERVCGLSATAPTPGRSRPIPNPWLERRG